MAGPILMRSSTRMLLLSTLLLSALTLYILLLTHQLRLPQQLLPDHLFGLGNVRSGEFDKPAAVTIAAGSNASRDRRTGQGLETTRNGAAGRPRVSVSDFSRYDTNSDGSLNKAEFERLVLNLNHLGIDPDNPNLPATGKSVVNISAAAAASTAVAAAAAKADAARAAASAAAADSATSEVTPVQSTSLVPLDKILHPVVLVLPAVSTAVVLETAVASAVDGEGCPELSRELVASFAKDNTIMLTVCDWKIFGTFGINWVKHLAKLNVDYWLVGATDKATAKYLGHTGKHPCFKFFEAGVEEHAEREYKYGDEHYRAATWRKVTVVSRIVAWGFNVIHSDVDVVWFRDPLPYMMGPLLAGVDWTVSTDLISTQNGNGDEGLEKGIHQHCNVNTGIYFVRSSPGGVRFMAGWAELRAKLSHENDQVGVYNFLRNRQASVSGRILTLEPQAAVPMKVGFLSTAVMLNGYSYFIPRLNIAKQTPALGLHLTWVPLSREGKFHRMRDGMLYYDDPEYYSGPRFMSADLDYPVMPVDYNNWRDTESMIQFHLGAMKFQERQVYRAMAVAVILNRTLILPRLKCFCNKNWFMSEQCRIPGDHVTQFPFDCTLDQWLRPKVAYKGVPIQGSSGPPTTFQFREFSMLDNPRTPPSVKDTSVVVTTQGSRSPPGTVKPKEGRMVNISMGLKQKALMQVLDPHAGAGLIHFSNVTTAFGGWDDKIMKESFESFLDQVTANWCCRDEPFIKAGMAKKIKLEIKWEYQQFP